MIYGSRSVRQTTHRYLRGLWITSRDTRYFDLFPYSVRNLIVSLRHNHRRNGDYRQNGGQRHKTTDKQQ